MFDVARAESGPPVHGLRARLDGAVVRRLDRTVNAAVEHWLSLFNGALGLYAGLPLIAPLAEAAGARPLASGIFWLYSLSCHQMPAHSWFIAGHQVAYCQRNTAIYTTMLLAGLLYASQRRWTRGLPLWAYLLLALPMAFDGGIATVGVRDSTPLLRTLTGSLFGAATIWFAYPVVDRLLAALGQRGSAPHPGA